MSNDRLKFRAWDKENETMVYVGDGDPYVFCIFEDSSLELRTFFDEAGYVPVESEFMQWTGLYDSEGAEIYEGDIVKAASQGSHAIVEVKWGKGRAGFFLHREYSGIVWNMSGGGRDGRDESITVIGNIHESPDLMERANG